VADGSRARVRNRVRAVLALCVGVMVAGPAGAQGVVVPTPGSAPTVAGPSSTNPSAAASGGLGATNPSAASSAVTTPGALNSSGTSSTFAPTSIGGTDRVLTRAAPQTRVVRERARSRQPRQARTRPGRKGEAREARPARGAAKAVLLPPAVMKDRDARARRITGSVCRGC
jgi:hypothetical protein